MQNSPKSQNWPMPEKTKYFSIWHMLHKGKLENCIQFSRCLSFSIQADSKHLNNWDISKNGHQMN